MVQRLGLGRYMYSYMGQTRLAQVQGIGWHGYRGWVGAGTWVGVVKVPGFDLGS